LDHFTPQLLNRQKKEIEEGEDWHEFQSHIKKKKPQRGKSKGVAPGLRGGVCTGLRGGEKKSVVGNCAADQKQEGGRG